MSKMVDALYLQVLSALQMLFTQVSWMPEDERERFVDNEHAHFTSKTYRSDLKIRTIFVAFGTDDEKAAVLKKANGKDTTVFVSQFMVSDKSVRDEVGSTTSISREHSIVHEIQPNSVRNISLRELFKALTELYKKLLPEHDLKKVIEASMFAITTAAERQVQDAALGLNLWPHDPIFNKLNLYITPYCFAINGVPIFDFNEGKNYKCSEDPNAVAKSLLLAEW